MKINKTPGVCGGVACIESTRLAVWIFIAYKQAGMTDKELLEAFPTLTTKNLADILHYYSHNKHEIDQEITDNMSEVYEGNRNA